MEPEVTVKDLESQIEFLNVSIIDQTERLKDLKEELKMRIKCGEKKDPPLVRVERMMKIKDFIAHSPFTTFAIFGGLIALLAFLSQ